MLCIHDAAMNGATFGGVLDALAAAGHRPVAFDLPAHGRSGGLDSLGSVAAMAAQLRALGERLGFDRPVLVGEGLGAAVALEAAAASPGWPAAVVVCGRLAPPSADEIDQLRQVTAGRARRQFDSTGYAPDTPREVYQRAFGEWVKTDPRATVGALAARAGWDADARLGAVEAPVTVVVGEHEDDDARATATTLASAVRRGTVVTLAGAGRRGVLEQPAGLAAIVADAAGAAS